MLVGCAKEAPVDPVKLAAAPSWALADCGDLEPIPVGDGDPAVRARHYGAIRSRYEACRDRQRVLAAYANTVSHH